MATRKSDITNGVNGGGNQDFEDTRAGKVIERGNPAVFKPVYAILDDTNIDLISIITTIIALAASLLFRVSWSMTLPIAAVVILPLRTFFPRPSNPQGLVLITGASSGIGAELAYIFAGKGHDIILVGRDEAQLKAVQHNINDKFHKTAHTVTCDLSKPGSAQKLYDEAQSHGWKVEVLVNNAGHGAAGETLEQDVEVVERMVTLNCITLVQLTQLFGKDMVTRGRGWLLQTSSIGGWVSSPRQNVYHSTKHFVRAFSEALSIEMRAHPGIQNTQIMPGPAHTQFITRSHAEETFMMAASGAVEDPKAVAQAAYDGLVKRKRMVFSSWNAATTATLMHLLPRSLHLTFGSLMNSPLRGWVKQKEPEKDQANRGQKLYTLQVGYVLINLKINSIAFYNQEE